MLDLKKYKEQCNKSKKKKAIKMLKSYDGKETSIEKKIRLFLTNEGIYFQQEYGIECIIGKTKHYKVYDFFVTGTLFTGQQFAFLIECDGSYFHAHDYLEGKTKYIKLSKLQKKNLANDNLKNKIAKKIGLPLLRLKEQDIKYDFDKTQKKILEMIDSFK